jgi:hypothetical protein
MTQPRPEVVLAMARLAAQHGCTSSELHAAIDDALPRSTQKGRPKSEDYGRFLGGCLPLSQFTSIAFFANWVILRLPHARRTSCSVGLGVLRRLFCVNLSAAGVPGFNGAGKSASPGVTASALVSWH